MTSFSAASGGGLNPPTALLTARIGSHYPTLAAAKSISAADEFTFTASSGTTQTALDITGKGVLLFSYFGSSSLSTSCEVVLTIDGVEVYNHDVGDGQEFGPMQVGILYANHPNGAAAEGFVPFNKSLKAVLTCNVNAVYLYNYYLT